MGSKKDIQWAPRVPQEWIQRLYTLDAQGIRDEELIEEVGWALRARCQSFVEAVEAVSGRVTCPKCGTAISHHSQLAEVLVCSACGWNLSWRDYFSTIQHKQLSGGEEILILFRKFIQVFPSSVTSEEKMVVIDRLLHGFHWWMVKGQETRSAAVNLIEGRYHEVVDFLDRLTYGEASTPGTSQTWLEWREVIQSTAVKWSDERLLRKPIEP